MSRGANISKGLRLMMAMVTRGIFERVRLILMKYGVLFSTMGMLGIFLLPGCGGGSDTTSIQQFGPLTARFAGTPQPTVMSSQSGSDISGVAGAAFSNLSLNTNRQKTLVGQAGQLGTKAAAFVYVTQGASVTSVAAIDAIIQKEVRISYDLSTSDSTVQVFSVTATHGISTFTYINGLSGETQTLIRHNTSSGAFVDSFQVIINPVTGTVQGIKAIHTLPVSSQ